MKKIFEWIRYNLLGGKQKKWKKDLLEKYKNQKDFDFKIEPVTLTYIVYNLETRRENKIGYVCKYSTDGTNYINIGSSTYDSSKNGKVWFVYSYNEGLSMLLKEFERYLEIKKVSCRTLCSSSSRTGG
jgi:hypothetical protein